MNPIEQIHQALCNDDPALLRDAFARHPELKARINEPAGPFDSPILHSARSRDMLDALIDVGADLNARSRWWAGGFGFLDLAGDDLADYAISRGARLDVHSAARLGRLGDLDRMLRENPDLVRARGGDGKTPLHCARHLETARLLTACGADLNARDIDHESTPAQHLIAESQEVVRFLVSLGAETDIFLAAALGDLSAAARLADASPDCLRMRVNAECFPMRNPRAGGTIYQWTLGFHISPHETAIKFGHPEMFRWLIDRSPPGLQLLVSCWAGDETAVRSILQRHPGLAAQVAPGEGRSVADAARNNNFAAVRLMLESGFPVDGRGQHRATPLHWAAWHGHLETTRLLLTRRAPLEDKNNDFVGTPLDWAIHGSENGWHRATGDYPAVVEALLSAGARIPARQDGTPEVRKLLRSHPGAPAR